MTTTTQPTSPSKPSLRSCRILIVEDDPWSRKAMTILLQRRGHVVTESGGVQEGMALLATRPDVLLLDLMLPDGSGVDLLRAIREQNQPIRVAVITGANDPMLLDATARLRPDLLLHKPIQMKDLDAWIAGRDV